MPDDDEGFEFEEEVDLPAADNTAAAVAAVPDEDDDGPYYEEEEDDDDSGYRAPVGADYPIALDEVAALVEDLENAAWTEWGLWGECPEGTRLRIRAAEFEKSESNYLTDHNPPETNAVRLQRALSRFLGRG